MPRRILASVVICLLVAGMAGCSEAGSSGDADRQQQAALDQYRTYLQRNVQKLTHWADTIVLKVKEGSWTKAGSRYAAARVPYGHLAPTAASFAPLNRRIDGLEPDVPPDEFAGFHRLEKEIFWQKSTYGMKLVAQQFRRDIEELGDRLEAAELNPGEIAAGAVEVLRGVQANEAWGEAEPWAHCDLTDMAAKLEGVDAAFRTLLPELEDRNPDLAKQIESQLRKAFAKVGEYGIFAREPEQARDREPGISFVVYDQITQEERWKFSDLFGDLADPVEEAAEELADS